MLAVEQKTVSRQRNALVSKPPTSFVNLSHVFGDSFQISRTIEGVVHKPRPGKLRCHVDNVGIRTGAGIVG
jgi:hypothetical protein